MRIQTATISPPLFAVDSIVSFASVTEIAALLDIYHHLRQWLPLERFTGVYEILDYETTLELLDRKGKTAVFRKHQRVKFLQDHTLAFQDYAWGDGETLENYHCSPGVVVDRYREGDRWNILVSLRESKNKGDIEDFHIERTVKNSFTQDNEWVQTEIRHWTRRLKMNVIFPANRHCQRAMLVERSRHKTTVLESEHLHELPDGRQMVSWEKQKIRPFEIFTLKWRW